MGLKYLMNVDVKYNTTLFREVAQYVAKASGRELPVNKPIVGANIFAHESGIHGDGVLKNPATYEAFKPEEVGLQRQIVIGKHSGKAAIRSKFDEYCIELDDVVAEVILNRVRQMSIDKKRPLFDKELIFIYEELKEQL